MDHKKVSVHYGSQKKNVDALKDHKKVSMHKKITFYTSHILTSEITFPSSLSTRIGSSLFVTLDGLPTFSIFMISLNKFCLSTN